MEGAPTSKIERVSEFTIPESTMVFNQDFFDDLKAKYNVRFTGPELEKIITSLKDKEITLPGNTFDVYDGLDKFNNRDVLAILFEQKIEEMEVQNSEKILRNIKLFLDSSASKDILLKNNFLTHLGFCKNEKNEVLDITSLWHNDVKEWDFNIGKFKTGYVRRAIVQRPEPEK